jgi:hypothetical protein
MVDSTNLEKVIQSKLEEKTNSLKKSDERISEVKRVLDNKIVKLRNETNIFDLTKRVAAKFDSNEAKSAFKQHSLRLSFLDSSFQQMNQDLIAMKVKFSPFYKIEFTSENYSNFTRFI